MKGLVVTLIAAAALVVPASASAATYTDSGSVIVGIGPGPLCVGCTVHIVNNTTGAKNTVTTGTAGQWHWGGFIGGDKYSIHADASFGECYYPSNNTDGPVRQPATSYDWDLDNAVLGVAPYANYPGCPEL